MRTKGVAPRSIERLGRRIPYATTWDDVLPVEVKELPEDLASLDELLSDHELLWPLGRALAP